MAKINIERTHCLGREVAREKAEELAERGRFEDANRRAVAVAGL